MARRKKKGVSAKKGENKENQPPESQHKASNRPTKLRIWSNQSMLLAMETVKSGYMGMNRAAIEHGVPRTSLKDRLSGRVIHGTNIGPKPYLTQEEEKQLVEFLVNCCKMGYGKTRGEVLKIVEAIMKKKGRKHEGRISQGWWCRFRNRWPSPCSNPSPASSSLSTPAVSSPSTPQAPPNTPIAEFLVYPTPIRKTKLEATSRSACVLTSAESRLLLKEKERNKKEEEEEKARRKSKREEKRVAREEEKKKKLEEREARKAEQAKKKSEKQNKAKGKRNPVEYLVPALSGNKRKLPGEFSGSVKTYPKRKRMDPKSNQETNEDVCCVCFGLYKDDVNKSNREWIQCSSEDCGIWSHVCCLEETDGVYVCAICKSVFM